MNFNILENQRVAILGFGKTGNEVLNILSNDNIILIDDNNSQCLAVSDALKYVDDIDVVIKSPGIPYDNAFLKAFEGTVVNDIELAYMYIKENNLDTQIIGITATNGKTTTTMMINEILNNFNYNSFVCGNIGVSPLSILNEHSNIDYLVMELSSYQLKNINHFKCDYAMFINISQDHLLYHGSMLDYFNSKLNILKGLTERQFEVGKSVLSFFDNHKAEISNNILENYKYTSDYNFQGVNIHQENASLSAKLLIKMGFEKETVIKEIKNFKGMEHRMEKVSSLFPFEIMNDSKATNVHATNSAIAHVHKPITLILGGSHKEEDYTLLDYQNKNIANIVVCGDNQNEFAFITDAVFTDSLKSAIQKAIEITKDGEVLLFSPASASFDEFKSFEERGEFFKAFVKEMENVIYN